MADINNLDLYGILGISITATTNEIRRAYRKKALKCHPDKNPDNPKAAELFNQLTEVSNVLLDCTKRAEYDQNIKAKEAARLRHSALDKERQRFKEQLEAREKASSADLSHEEKSRKELIRLEKEGAKLLQEEIISMQQAVFKTERIDNSGKDLCSCQIKVSWVAQSQNCDQYSQDTLQTIFSKYGNVAAVAVAGNKAIIEFDDANAATLAIKIEVGFLDNPLNVRAFKETKKEKSRKRAYQN